VSLDSLNDSILGEFHQANPKFGIIGDITSATTLRLAAFRTLKRSLLTDQTIEPTQVAGFNQFFDDNRATESRRYGIALDHKFSSNLYGGLEVSKRDLEVPVLLGMPPIEDWKEELYRAYLNWTPHPRIALNLGYQLEDFEDEDNIIPPNTRTHLGIGTLRYFHPFGFFGRLDVTYVNQEVEFGTVDSSDSDSMITRNTRSDRFGLVDVAVGYRLPKRYGIFSLGVKNVFNENFNFQGLGSRTRDEEGPPFLPERSISVQFTLAF
jgi:hypothetical protein